MKPIAAQLYSVREAAAENLPGVLEQVARIGYKGVELAGLHGMTPAEVRRVLDDLGLEVHSAFMPTPTAENAGQLVDDCRALGVTRLITGPGGPVDTMDGVLAATDRLRAGVEALEGSGIDLVLHNHAEEFRPVDGQLPEDILLDAVPGLLAEVDVYFVAMAGWDPVETVARLKHRTHLLHLKDGMVDPWKPHTAVGSGVLDMPAIVNAADPGVLEWLIVELEYCATDMMQALEDSYRYLVNAGLGYGNA